MALYSFIGVAVTSATTIIYGETIWDPVDVLTRFTNPVVLVVAMLALCIATLATNIAANVVSPANDFAHLAPRKISFRIGGFITGVIGILMMPWKLVADPSGYIFTWLIGYSALLGPIGGILIADYFVVRRTQLDVDALYRDDGEYRFTNGFSLAGLGALVARRAAESARLSRHGEAGCAKDAVPAVPRRAATTTRGSSASPSRSSRISSLRKFHPSSVGIATLRSWTSRSRSITSSWITKMCRCSISPSSGTKASRSRCSSGRIRRSWMWNWWSNSSRTRRPWNWFG